MSRKRKIQDRFWERRFEWTIFLLTFVIFGVLFTLQMRILGDYIRYTEIPFANGIAIIIFWILFALGFTVFTNVQINRRYRNPIKLFAQATEKVANGDFSVYISPKHSAADRQDFLDKIFIDFNKMVEELGSIETLKTDFFSNVSHEIKTPLAAIQNYAEMLQDERLTEQQRREYAASIMASTHRLSALITNILKLNKLEKQTIRPAPAPYDLCEQLCACVLQFEAAWEKKDIELIADIEDRATIDADESLLEIVWNNLLSNAIKFSEPGGTVTLAQSSTADEIVVSVTDTGCGMDKETARRVFDKFYQGDTSHATEGNGLGMALVLRILQLIGGSITVDSEIGNGTTFTVYVPVRSEMEEGIS